MFAISPTNEIKPIITGTIVSKAGEPVIGAEIIVEGTLAVAVTDVNGKFELNNINPGNYILKISAFGFKSCFKSIVLTEGDVLDMDIVCEDDEFLISEILIFGKSDRLFTKTPGSATFINTKEINLINPISANEVLRRSPGVHVTDEEGVGMRANIGIRGLDPDRSRSLLILEDGVPVSLAPYGEPEMYYSPPIDRMSGVEILKGSGQILYGPQTIGGVINYVTASPPEESSGKISLKMSEGGFFSGLISYGNTYGNTGMNFSYLKKRADKIGLTAFDINDLQFKLVINNSLKSSISLKAGIYDETSNSTYIGLTQTMYDQGGQDFVHMAPDDKLDIRRYSLSTSYDYRINRNAIFKTIAYGYTTTRNWRRQDFSSNGTGNTKPSNWTGQTWGDESVVNGAVFMRNSTGNRNRQFEVAGLESRLELEHKLFNIDNQLKTGVRYLYEKAYEQRINGSKSNASSGEMVEDEQRLGNAISGYFQNVSAINEKFSLNIGVRFERFDYSRNIFRRTFRIGDQNRIRDTILVKSNQLTQLIPGGGFNWNPNKKITLFGGMHAGFAPPRTKDAISNIGEAYDLEAEKSINTELGIRMEPIKGIRIECTGFNMNFSNQVIPVSESSGGAGTGLINGGRTIHRGIESAVIINLSNLAGWDKTEVIFDANISYTNAQYNGPRFINEINIDGNRTPYAPEFLINSTATIQHISGIALRLSVEYVGNQFSDELNTTETNPNGQTGLIPSYFIAGTNLSYALKKWNTTFSLSAKNITNERYIVNRRPQGIRVGLPRLIMAGVEYMF